jgi:hypothetical protein
MRSAALLPMLLALAVAALAPACEKTDDESIDKWVRTQKGPEKLRKAVANESLDADLSAHAAANLIKMGEDADVRTILETMGASRRAEVIAKLAPRLWTLARVEGEMTMPGPDKVAAKDALFAVRKFADEKGRGQIDGYLTEWYTGGYYEGRAQLGANLGATVMRTLGPAAGKKLMDAANAVVARPASGGKRVRIGDELLLGMAASSSPEAVKYVLDIAHMDRGDTTLTGRALSALYRAYVDSHGLFDLADPAGLVPNLDAIVAIAKDDTNPNQVTNDAVSLIRVVGMPHCLPPLVSMVAFPHRDPRYRYLGANNALKCGGVKAILEVVRALPEGGYPHADLAGAVWGEIASLTPRDQVLAAARELLGDKGRIARWVAIEVLAALKSKEDADRIKGVSGPSERLTGYWAPGESDKAEPTLGQRAAELAAGLTK